MGTSPGEREVGEIQNACFTGLAGEIEAAEAAVNQEEPEETVEVIQRPLVEETEVKRPRKTKRRGRKNKQDEYAMLSAEIDKFNLVKKHKKDKKKTEEVKVELGVDYEQQRLAMEELFGTEGAKEIYGLEAKMMLNYEKYCDDNRPQLWPCLPLNMKFDF